MAYAARRLAEACAEFDLSREQLRMVRARGEPSYDATDLAGAEQTLGFALSELRRGAVELLAEVGNEVLDTWTPQGDTP